MWSLCSAALAQVATLQLEFQYLSFHSKNAKYGEATDRIMHVLEVSPVTLSIFLLNSNV